MTAPKSQDTREAIKIIAADESSYSLVQEFGECYHEIKQFDFRNYPNRWWELQDYFEENGADVLFQGSIKMLKRRLVLKWIQDDRMEKESDDESDEKLTTEDQWTPPKPKDFS